MAHFAEIDSEKKVIRVLVVDNSELEPGNEEASGVKFLQSIFGANTQWLQTSYSANFRKNFAGIGDTYDAQKDAFIPQCPGDNYILNETTCQWEILN